MAKGNDQRFKATYREEFPFISKSSSCDVVGLVFSSQNVKNDILNMPVSSESVKVVVRCRPLNEKEISDGHHRIIEMVGETGVVDIKNPKSSATEPGKEFTFDAIYNWNSMQSELYNETCRPLIDSVLNGFNGTIFAYGQTGTGKTYTMEGVRGNPEKRGVVPNSFEHIFSHIARSHNQQYLVRASYLEIYQEEIRDLLEKDQKKRLELKERADTGVYVKDLSSFVCKSIEEIEHVMNVGNQNRSVGATNMNEHSSRSHAIFIITIEHSELGPDGQNHIRVGKLNLVDLAGSERQAKTGAVGERQKEAIKINLSLSALGNVISALVDSKTSHIPYRDSKLTRLLQDSLGGNAKTLMIANIGPAAYNYEESLTTLRYANRAKNIKNKPRVNEDPKDALLRQFQQEIAKLKATLANRTTKKKKKKKHKNNEEGSDGDEVVEDDCENEGNSEDFIKEEQQKLEEERMSIINDKNIISEEKEKMLNEMIKQQDELQKEQVARDKLATKINAMESKLLCGGKNIIDHTNEQQWALEIRRQELTEQTRREREIQQKLSHQEESALEIKETFTSLQQEVDIKTKRLKKLFAKLQAVTAETRDLQDIHSQERQELEQTQNELTRDLKMKLLIIDNFIPPQEKSKILNRAFYDEDEDMWKLMPISTNQNQQQQLSKRPVSAAGFRRPVSEYAKMAATMGGNPRYKAENILSVELDLPSRTTSDYQAPSLSPSVVALWQEALRAEEDLDIDVSSSVIPESRIKSSKRDRNKMKHPQSHQPDIAPHFPQSRGLVPK
ncbi:Kinesin-like protein KIF3B [Nymphon striatum]|nr:Kinesin-like protein KIF3B [Nymphon striatum]